MRRSIQKSVPEGISYGESKALTLKGEKDSGTTPSTGILQDMDVLRDETSLSVYNAQTQQFERILTDKSYGHGYVYMVSRDTTIGRIGSGVMVINESDNPVVVDHVFQGYAKKYTFDAKSIYILSYNNGWTRIGEYTEGSIGGGTGIYRGMSPNEIVYASKVAITDSQAQWVSYVPLVHNDGSGPDPAMIFERVDYNSCNFDLWIHARKNDGTDIMHRIENAHYVFDYAYNNGFSAGNIGLDGILLIAQNEFGAEEFSSWWGQLAIGSTVKLGFVSNWGNLSNGNIIIKFFNENKFFSADKHVVEFPIYMKPSGSPTYNFEYALFNKMSPTSNFYEYGGSLGDSNAATYPPERRYKEIRHKIGQKFIGDVYNGGSEVPAVEKLISGRILYRGVIGEGFYSETVEVGYRFYNHNATWLYNSSTICRPAVLYISDDMDNGVTGNTYYDGTADGFYYVRPIIEYGTEEAYYNYRPITSNNLYSTYPSKYCLSTDPYFDPISFVDWSKFGPIVNVGIRLDGEWYIPLWRRYGENCSIFHFDGNDGFPDIITGIVDTDGTTPLVHPVFSNDKVHYVKLLITNNDPAINLRVKPNRRNAPTMTIRPGEDREVEIYTERHPDNPNYYAVNCRVWFETTPSSDAMVSLTEIGIGEKSPKEMEFYHGAL